MEPVKFVKRPLNPAYSRSVDGVVRIPRQSVVNPPKQLPVQPIPQPLKTKVAATPDKKQRWVAILQTSLVVVLGIGAGLIFQFLPLGQVAVILYGIVAVTRKVPSKITFILLLAAFLCLGVLAALGHDGIITRNIAIYAFFLFIIGVASAALETRHVSKQTSNQSQKEAPIQQT